MAAIQDKISSSILNPEKVGIMDILVDHLQAVTKTFQSDTTHWLEDCNTYKELDLNFFDDPEHKAERDKKSAELRNEGNVLFKAGRYPDARLLYTQSIASATGRPVSALAYSNRSAALFHMRLYKDCIKDIDRALVLGYPNQNLEYNLHLRRAMCLQFLKKDHAESLLNSFMAIEEHNKSKSEELKAKVLTRMKEPEPVFNIDLPKPNKWKLPELSYGPSKENPSFSSAVSIKYTKELGRHLVANRSINTGDVLVVEKSIVTTVYENVHWDFCGFCYKPCMSLIPCKRCRMILYCSVSCRQSDWNSSHEHSCCYTIESETPDKKVLDLNKTQEQPHFAGIRSAFSETAVCLQQRLIQFIGLDIIRSAAKKNEPMPSWRANDPRIRGFRDGKFDTVDLEALISLEDNFNKLDSSEKKCFSSIALHLSALLKIPLSELLSVSAVLLKLILVTVFNRKCIYSFKTNYEQIGVARIPLGEVMYLAVSLINHGCDASVYLVSYGSHAVYRARRPMKKGEQLTDCYVMSAANAGYRDRQKCCKSQFKFSCKCEACEDAWPQVSMMPQMSMFGTKEMKKAMKAAKFDIEDVDMINKFIYYCDYVVPVDKEMLPKMLALLWELNKSGAKMNQWYFKMQECIKNHYRTKGNCYFFKDAKDILSGAKKLDVEDAVGKTNERLDNCLEFTDSFGEKGYL